METISENKCFGGTQLVLQHSSEVCDCDMTFGLFLPRQAQEQKVPVLWYLSGLTCTHENAMTKAGAQAHAARYGMAVVFPDTSPRGDDVPDDEEYDLGKGAGFYVNATQEPWNQHFRMWDYIASELPDVLARMGSIDMDRQAITGHSMGGHGALILAMGFPDRFASVSAFAPIAHPTASDWGRKQMGAYLGTVEAGWAQYDATLQMRSQGLSIPLLVDQGGDDQFLDLLKPEAFVEAMAAQRHAGVFRMQKGYDHSYFFVSTFMGDHVAFHAEALGLK